MTTKTNFDALALDPETPQRLILINPSTGTSIKNEKGEEAYIMLLGMDSATAVKHKRAATDSHLSRGKRGKVKAAELEGKAAEMLAALTKDWHLISFKGENIDVPCTKEAALELYTNSHFSWIYDQVNEFTDDRANFMKK